MKGRLKDLCYVDSRQILLSSHPQTGFPDIVLSLSCLCLSYAEQKSVLGRTG